MTDTAIYLEDHLHKIQQSMVLAKAVYALDLFDDEDVDKSRSIPVKRLVDEAVVVASFVVTMASKRSGNLTIPLFRLHIDTSHPYAQLLPFS